MDNKNNASILIADDDEDIRLALALLLQAKGFSILEAENAKEVIIQTERQKPDLILLDTERSPQISQFFDDISSTQYMKPLYCLKKLFYC